MWGPKFLEATVPHTLLIFMFGEDLQVGTHKFCSRIYFIHCAALSPVAFGGAARSGLAGHGDGPGSWVHGPVIGGQRCGTNSEYPM